MLSGSAVPAEPFAPEPRRKVDDGQRCRGDQLRLPEYGPRQHVLLFQVKLSPLVLRVLV